MQVGTSAVRRWGVEAVARSLVPSVSVQAGASSSGGGEVATPDVSLAPPDDGDTAYADVAHRVLLSLGLVGVLHAVVEGCSPRLDWSQLQAPHPV